ncbi:hypothetical protein T12_6476 [Trichinella patagoniensis]|uniref:Transmembrane protein n=1 Tax=Trichinella patagoniensis TaxID=990121 RepID=A0A0V0ZAT4_9BILA|nr:hypothetical protein T12_6476 [Trichinella patagoniensis]
MKLIVNHDPVELGYRSRHIWTWRSVAEYGSGQTRGSDWWCAVLIVWCSFYKLFTPYVFLKKSRRLYGQLER